MLADLKCLLNTNTGYSLALSKYLNIDTSILYLDHSEFAIINMTYTM